jgi:hypothetical protein
MTNPTPPGEHAEYSLQPLPGVVFQNLDQDIIHITADKARLYLGDWCRKIEAQGSWIAPLSLGAGLLLSLLTADFKDRLGVPKEYWSALFFVSLLATAIWLGRTLWHRCFNRAESVEEIVTKFKNVPPSGT